MNDKDIFELFLNGLTARNTSDSYNLLCNFVSAIHCGQYYPISDEDIRCGVECEKAQTKAKAKILFMGFSDDIKKAMEAAIELKYSLCLQQFLNYKHTYEKPSNHVI